VNRDPLRIARSRSGGVRAARRFVANRGAVVGAVLALALVGVAIAGMFAAPNAMNIDDDLSTIGAPLPPSAHAPLGTDHLGRDVWSRIAAGATTSLTIAAAATCLAIAIGVAVGLVAGYAGGWSTTRS